MMEMDTVPAFMEFMVNKQNISTLGMTGKCYGGGNIVM